MDSATVSLPAWVPWTAAASGLAGMGTAGIWMSCHVHPDPVLLDTVRFLHVASMVVAFGAVLAVDWVALLWLSGRRTLRDVLRCASDGQVPIWAGYVGLVLSGAMLQPDLASPLTQVKLGLVLLVGWNGLVALWLHGVLSDAPRSVHLRISSLSALCSQGGWWGAMLIGFLNSR